MPLFIYIVWCVSGQFIPSLYNYLFHTFNIVFVIILSIISSLVSIVDIWLYGFSKEQYQQRELTNQYMREQREKERNLSFEVAESRKREHREFITEKSRRR